MRWPRDAATPLWRPCTFRVIGQPLCGVGNGGGVDAVGAGPIFPESTCAKRQIRVERIDQRLAGNVIGVAVSSQAWTVCRVSSHGELRPRLGFGTHLVQEEIGRSWKSQSSDIFLELGTA